MSNGARPLRRATFYTKAGCHLCEQAEELLEDARSAYDLHVTSVDITSDMAIFERYKYEIPIIAVEGGATVSGRITIDAVLRALGGRG